MEKEGPYIGRIFKWRYRARQPCIGLHGDIVDCIWIGAEGFPWEYIDMYGSINPFVGTCND